MKRQSKLSSVWVVGLLLTLVVGLNPVPGLASSAGAEASPAGVPPSSQTVALEPAPRTEGPAPAEAAIAGGDAGWWSTVQENIRTSEYNITWQEQTYLDDVPAAYQAPNRGENLRTYFTPEGPTVIPRVWPEEAAAPPWRWEASLVAWGRAGTLQPVAQAELQVQENLIEYRRGGLIEWYRNDEQALEQGFTLLSAPEVGQPGQPLQLDLAFAGDLIPQMVGGGGEIEWRTPGGDDGLRYGGLQVMDATGELLPAWLALQDSTLSILIEDADAVYPIEVDPTITGLSTDHDWAITFGQPGAEWGTCVATAGDVDGDGYSEVIVGAPDYDGGLVDQGGVFVYYGSSSGLYTWSDWYELIDRAGAHYGQSVATAGDVNGDGFADVIVGAPDYTGNTGHEGEGGTWVYHGSGDGLSHDWSTHDEGNQAGAAFGYSVATAGDVNGDGYSDVIVGALLYHNGETEEGRVWVWHGSEDGLSETHNWRAESNETEAALGISVATAGDVNRDGYADIIVGAHRFTHTHVEQGAAFIWLGSADGVNGGFNGTPTNAHRHLEINQVTARFGHSVSTAGDVNGDGYADVIVGAPYYTNGQGREGGAWLYLGSGSGVSTSAANQDEGNQTGAHFGWSVATAGDVNGDGYADVIVGAPDYTVTKDQQGRAWVWHGQPTSNGISTTRDWDAEGEQADAFFGKSVATAGDVDGDGYSDIIVGAPGHASAAGRCYVYHGGPDSLSEYAGWTKASNMANALFGLSVGTAGDVNGDGYADVIVGSPRWDGGQAFEGKAWVYLGDSDGLNLVPHWYKEPDNEYAEFGTSVGSAGDVNGDGYDDVIVGAPGWHTPQTDEGGAWIYKGSSSGLVAAPLWHKESNQEGAKFGTSVGTAGDVNGDGYADVIVGAPFFSNGSSKEGMAWIYYGSDPAPHLTPDWDGEGNQANAGYGHAVGTAGDVNRDGYSDIIVGAPTWNGDETNEGRAWVYHGSPGGVSETYVWRQRGSKFNAQYGYSVGTAGDVNGDGYADVIVGAPNWWDDRENEGKVWVYRGSSTGLGTTSSWYREGGQNHAHYGFSVGTAGDVNGDGYADVIIGIEGWNGGLANEGGASVYHGSYGGLESSRAWHGESDQTSAHYGYSVGTAGDVNGDGYAEVIVGAPNYQTRGDKLDEGQAFLYYGNGGPGASLHPRQQHSGGAPLPHLGRSNDLDSFRVRLRAGTPFGRGRILLECEVKPLGARFTGSDTHLWGDYQNAVPGHDKYMVPGSLAASTPYSWRVRWRYSPATTPFMPASRWVTVPWNGWNEKDLITGGFRNLLPLVTNNYD
jgi:hypothetical protein